MRRLHLQIWAAFLLVAVLSLATAGLATRLLINRALGATDDLGAVAGLLIDDLPDPEADPKGFGRALAGRARQLGLHVSVWSARGAPLGRVGDALAAPPKGCARPLIRAPSGAPGLCLQLPDGRWVAAAAEPEASRALALRGGGALLAVLAAVAIGSWPLARRITRRLGAVERGVRAFGAGQLTARVPVEGDDEVAALAAAFNEAAGQVDALVAGQRRVLAHASHELRSPLARLRMALALLDDEEPTPPAAHDDVLDVIPAPQAACGPALAAPADGAAPDPRQAARRQALDEAVAAVTELDALIEDVLLASRLRSGAPPRPPAPVDLAALCAPLAAARGAAVQVSAGLPPAWGDPRLLRRAVGNLIENALKHGAPPVCLRLRVEGGDLVVHVDDAGPGVPKDERARIFEPFYQAPGRAEGDPGVGLGLALVHEIAAHHGGSVRCDDAPGGGARFSLRLPALGRG
jgi:signal transduction histidine kinase